MKILCVANEIDPVLYNNKIVEQFSDIDIIVSAGGLPIEYLNFIARTLNKNIYYVLFDNEIESSIEPPDARLIPLTKPIIVGNTVIAGLSGAEKTPAGIKPLTPFRSRKQRLATSLYIRLSRAQGKMPQSIIVSYCNIQDSHIRHFIKRCRPHFLIYGQEHLDETAGNLRITDIFNTKCINASEHFVLDTEQLGFKD